MGCYVHDVAAGRELARQGFAVASSDWRRAAHKCSGLAYQAITGAPGMFDTRIAYVAESGVGDARTRREAFGVVDHHAGGAVATALGVDQLHLRTTDRAEAVFALVAAHGAVQIGFASTHFRLGRWPVVSSQCTLNVEQLRWRLQGSFFCHARARKRVFEMSEGKET